MGFHTFKKKAISSPKLHKLPKLVLRGKLAWRFENLRSTKLHEFVFEYCELRNFNSTIWKLRIPAFKHCYWNSSVPGIQSIWRGFIFNHIWFPELLWLAFRTGRQHVALCRSPKLSVKNFKSIIFSTLFSKSLANFF